MAEALLGLIALGYDGSGTIFERVARSLFLPAFFFVAEMHFTKSYEVVAARHARLRQFKSDELRQEYIDLAPNDPALNQPEAPLTPSKKSIETIKLN